MNGVSKKLTVTVLCILKVADLAKDADNKIPYMAGIVVIAVIYKLVQCRIDVIKTKYGVGVEEEPEIAEPKEPIK